MSLPLTCPRNMASIHPDCYLRHSLIHPGEYIVARSKMAMHRFAYLHIIPASLRSGVTGLASIRPRTLFQRRTQVSWHAHRIGPSCVLRWRRAKAYVQKVWDNGVRGGRMYVRGVQRLRVRIVIHCEISDSCPRP